MVNKTRENNKIEMGYFNKTFSKKTKCPLTEDIESNPNIFEKLNHYCAQIIAYLNSPLFDKREIIEVKQLIELTQRMQAGTIQAKDFYKHATQFIEQIRLQIPPLSFAWKLLDIVAGLVVIALIIVVPFGIPIAAAYGLGKAATGSKFEFSFFGKRPEEKKLDQIEILVDKIQNATSMVVSVTENDDAGLYHRTVASTALAR